jgi:acyl carrier protein
VSVQERVGKVVCEQLGIGDDEVQIDSSFVNDLGADSLDTVELVMALEEEFELEISDDEEENSDGKTANKIKGLSRKELEIMKSIKII